MSLWDPMPFNLLVPLADHPAVSKLWIVRPRESVRPIPKSETIVVSGPLPHRLLRMEAHCLRLARRPRVAALVSFNPFPYGTIAGLAARACGLPCHFGFIGSDWFKRGGGWWLRTLKGLLRSGDLITVTGPRMKEEMIRSGLPGKQIRTLPHTIDQMGFAVGDPVRTDYACVFVGSLIELKKVDVIIRAMAGVAREHPDARLCILGDGPLMGVHQALARDLGVSENIDFVGHVTNVASYLRRAKILVMASTREGFPFAMAEAMSCGLVPVCTPVGTIPDLIEDGVNGFLFPVGNPMALTEKICRLLGDGALYRRVRERVLDLREEFGFGASTEAWDPWLRTLAGRGAAVATTGAGRGGR